MRVDRPLATTALAFLFLAEGQRAWVASIFALAYDAVFPVLLPGPLALAALPLAAILAPLLPAGRRFDRGTVVALAVAGLAVFRLPLSVPEFAVRAIAATLVVACAGVFLGRVVGWYEERTVAVGALLGLVADQLLRLAGTSWDLSLRPGWLPVQAVLSLALLWLVLAPARDARAAPARADSPGSEYERRSAGLRMRGALALGALLFLDLHLLGLPPVLARWTGAPYALGALAVTAAGGIALAVALAGPGPVRDRRLALGLVALLALALAAGPLLGGPAGALLMAAGHAAALLLVVRALSPASGRRGGVVVTAGLLAFTLFTALYSATFFHAYLFPLLEGAAPWVVGGAVALVAAAFLLLPQPPPAASPARIPAALAIAGTVTAIGAGIVLVVQRPAPRPVPTAAAAAAPGPGAPGGTFRAATWNIHYGYDERWRFDPGAMARALLDADADIVALQEVPVGMPTAYGVDFPLWLERRLGIPAFFSGNTNGLQGEAILARVPTRAVRSVPLPPPGSDPAQLLTLSAVLGGRSVDVHAIHMSVHEGERAVQIRAALEAAGDGRAIFLGDLNAEPGSPETLALAAAGFDDAFEVAGAAPAATWPAREPEVRIDWIWVRGVGALAAEVRDPHPSDHRMVVATLQVDPPNR